MKGFLKHNLILPLLIVALFSVRCADGGTTIPTPLPTISPSPVATQHPDSLLGWSSGYYAAWRQASYPPQMIPWKAITYLIYHSVMTSSQRNGSLNLQAHQLTPAFMQAAVAEAHKHKVKILLSVGGAEDRNFDAACNPLNRAAFIHHLVQLLQTYGYDGIDLDIEQDFGYPAHSDYVACVQGLRSALDQLTPRPTLTMAADADWQGYMASQVWHYVDQINLMSYWTDVKGIAAKLHNFTSRGIPKSKLGIGMGLGDSGGVDTTAAQCDAKANYATTNGYGGVMEWLITDDLALHHGQTPCTDALSHYVPH